jgi:tetratricopeptide (TPR) repeat protein
MSFIPRYARSLKIFFAYSQHRKDENLRQELEDHLHELRTLGVDRKWHKCQQVEIETEQDWEDEIYQDLNTADMIVLLVSSTFLNEPYWDAVVERAMERYEEEEVPIIPVLLRPANGWQNKPFGSLEPLPRSGAVASLPNRDEAFVAVAQGIVGRVNDLQEYRQKLQEYEQHFSEAIQREYPLSEYASQYLNNFKQNWRLKNKDIAPIEERITRQKQRQEQQRLQQYKNEIFQEIQREYPLSVQAIERLKDLQQSLNLKENEVQEITEQTIEEYITRLQENTQQPILEQSFNPALLAGIIVTVITGFLFFGNLSSSPTTSAESFFQQGYKKFDRGDCRGAIEDHTQAISRNSNYANAYLERGNAYYCLNDKRAAIRDYTQALRIAPDEAKAYNNRGAVYSDLGDKQRAIEDYQKAAKLYKQQKQIDSYKNTLNELKKLQQ